MFQKLAVMKVTVRQQQCFQCYQNKNFCNPTTMFQMFCNEINCNTLSINSNVSNVSRNTATMFLMLVVIKVFVAQ